MISYLELATSPEHTSLGRLWRPIRNLLYPKSSTRNCSSGLRWVIQFDWKIEDGRQVPFSQAVCHGYERSLCLKTLTILHHSPIWSASTSGFEKVRLDKRDREVQIMVVERIWFVWTAKFMTGTIRVWWRWPTPTALNATWRRREVLSCFSVVAWVAFMACIKLFEPSAWR